MSTTATGSLLLFAFFGLPAMLAIVGLICGGIALAARLNGVPRAPIGWRGKARIAAGGLYVVGCTVLDSQALAPATTRAVLTTVAVLVLCAAAIMLSYGAMLVVAKAFALACAALARVPGVAPAMRFLGRILLILPQLAWIIGRITLAVLAICMIAAAARERGRGPRPYFGVFVRNGRARPYAGLYVPTSLGAVGFGRRGMWAAFGPRRRS